MEKEIKFIAEIWKTGNSNVITIPKDLIDCKLIKIGQKYSIILEETT